MNTTSPSCTAAPSEGCSSTGCAGFAAAARAETRRLVVGARMPAAIEPAATVEAATRRRLLRLMQRMWRAPVPAAGRSAGGPVKGLLEDQETGGAAKVGVGHGQAWISEEIMSLQHYQCMYLKFQGPWSQHIDARSEQITVLSKM